MRRAPKPRCSAQVMAVMERAMSLHAAGSKDRAVDVLMTVCHTDADAFSTACGFAAAIAAAAPGEGRVGVDVTAEDGVSELPPEASDKATLLGSFIAGAGNNDLSGVALAWMRASMETRVHVLLDLFNMATLVATMPAESGQ